MLDELLGTWLDKRKAKRELIKAFKFYRKEYKKARKHYNHTFDTEYLNGNYDVIDEAYNDMKSLDDILKALAYVLYSNFNMFGWEDGFLISTYYDLHKDEGKKYFEKIKKEHDDTFAKEDDEWDEMYKQAQKQFMTWRTHTNDFKGNHYSKGDIVYDMENRQYMSDGKIFIEMC